MSQEGPLEKAHAACVIRASLALAGRYRRWAPFRRCRRAWCVGECNDGVGSRGDHFIVPNLTGNAAWLRHASLQDGAGKPAVRWETGGGDTSSRCRAATTLRRQKFGVPREGWPSRKLACAQLWLAVCKKGPAAGAAQVGRQQHAPSQNDKLHVLFSRIGLQLSRQAYVVLELVCAAAGPQRMVPGCNSDC